MSQKEGSDDIPSVPLPDDRTVSHQQLEKSSRDASGLSPSDVVKPEESDDQVVASGSGLVLPTDIEVKIGHGETPEKSEESVTKAESLEGSDTSYSDEGRMQIRLSVSEDSSSEPAADDAEAFPTTIFAAVEETADDSNDDSAATKSSSTFIPTTVDTDEESESRNYGETSVAAFNSFWKYKKLPKGPKVRQTYELEFSNVSDPHKPLVFNDPVFDKSQKNAVVYYGKARIGEGNDITPNPKKLIQLGTDIKRINLEMAALGNSSVDKREKMKLSSRICRMKRSANHEANKIKFAGLEQEREELCKVIREMRRAKASGSAPSTSNLTAQLYHTKVAGRTSEYVNSVLEGVKLPGATQYSDTDSDSD